MKKFFALIALLLTANIGQNSFAADATRILIVVGPTNHPPGTHEVAAGGRLMKYCLENMASLPKTLTREYSFHSLAPADEARRK